MNWAEFFHMGGYAFHVWSSWFLSLAALLIIVIIGKVRNAKIKQRLARQYRRDDKLNTSASDH